MNKYALIFGVKNETSYMAVGFYTSVNEALKEAEILANNVYGLTKKDIINYFQDMGKSFLDSDVEKLLNIQRKVNTFYKVYKL
jgi:hypothetical protein